MNNIKDKNLDNLVPKQRKKPKDYKKNKTDGLIDDYDLWYFPTENPSDQEIKVMLAEVIAIAVKVVFNNHVFKFDGDIYIQVNEGGTGVRLTGVLAEIVMILWCSELSRRMENAGLDMHLFLDLLIYNTVSQNYSTWMEIT